MRLVEVELRHGLVRRTLQATEDDEGVFDEVRFEEWQTIGEPFPECAIEVRLIGGDESDEQASHREISEVAQAHRNAIHAGDQPEIRRLRKRLSALLDAGLGIVAVPGTVTGS